MNLICAVCGNRVEMPAKRIGRYMLDSNDDFYCSLPCLKFALRQRPPAHEVKIMENFLPKNDYSYYDNRLGLYFRSEFEARVMGWLLDNFKTVDYERWTLVLSDTKTYTPDFYLKESDTFVEVKGLWNFGAKTKIKEARKQGVRVILIPWTMQAMFPSRPRRVK